MKELYKTIHLIAIDPMGVDAIIAKYFSNLEEADAWAQQHNKIGKNIYFTVNSVTEGLSKKPSKDQITLIMACYVDIDPNKEKNREDERLRIKNIIDNLRLEPSIVIDSGNGYCPYWFLKYPLTATPENIEMVESYNKLIAQYLGGDNCFNIDRIMRYPNTVNYPTPTKLRAGYKQCISSIYKESDKLYTIDEIKTWIGTFMESITKNAKKQPKTSGKQPTKNFELLLKRDEKLRQLFNGHPTESQKDTSRSGYDMTLVGMLKSRGLNEKETFAALQMFQFGKVGEVKDPVEYFRKMWDETLAEQPLVLRVPATDLTDRYSYVKEFGKFFDGKTGIFLSKEVFNDVNLLKYPGNKNGPRASEAFLTDPEGIQADTVTWIPNGANIIQEGTKLKLNMYVKPTMTGKEGDVSRWLSHIEYLLPDESQREHLLDWMAYTMQFPEHKINHQVLMAGGARVGKDSLFAPMIEYFGTDNVAHPQAEQMHSGFNEYLNGKKLIMVEEIMNYEKRTYENQLKPLCAAPPKNLHINVKGLRQYEIPNLCALVFFSNEFDAIGIRTKGDTRYFCLWVEVERKEDSYYDELWSWYEDGGFDFVIWYLLHRDVSKFKPGHGAPDTEYRKELMALSISHSEATIRDAYRAKEGVFKNDLILTKDLVQAYREEGVKSLSYAAILLKRMGFVKFVCRYRNEDGESTTTNVWAVRNIDKYQKIYVEKQQELVNLYNSQF